jgi:hypothetical protein
MLLERGWERESKRGDVERKREECFDIESMGDGVRKEELGRKRVKTSEEGGEVVRC